MSVSLRDAILEKQKQRYAYLLNLYELSDGSKWDSVSHIEICQKIGIDADQTGGLVFHYLEGEGLAKLDGMGWPDSSILITHEGIREVEASINQPKESTKHFQTQAITMIQNFHGAVGAVQNGDNSHANVQQNIGANAEQLTEIFTQMRQNVLELPDSQKIGAECLVDSLEAEVNSATPDPERVKQIASGIWGLASGVLGQLAATYIQGQLGM